MTKGVTQVLLGLLLSPCVLAGAKGEMADLTAEIFSEHMVLQRQVEVPVRGNTEPGGTVTVMFMNQTKSATDDDEGKWLVKLDKMEAVEYGQRHLDTILPAIYGLPNPQWP